MAPALPPLVQTLSPIPCMPQARPTSQMQIPPPQTHQQFQSQPLPPQATGWAPNPSAGHPAGTYFRGHLVQRAGAGPVPPPVTWPYITGHAPLGAFVRAPYHGTGFSNPNDTQVGTFSKSDSSGGEFSCSTSGEHAGCSGGVPSNN